MAPNQKNSKESHHFPTHPAYLVPIEIRDVTGYGDDQKGVFAKESIPKGTKLWVWTHRVISIHQQNLQAYIDENFGDDKTKIKIFLRQGFVLPQSSSSETMTLTTTTTTPLPTEASPPSESNTPTEETKHNATNDDNKDNHNNDDFFHSNPTDSGRLTNHSANPNTGPDGALRDILPGEEMTMDYSFHGNPEWYQTICSKYGIMTEAQVAASAV